MNKISKKSIVLTFLITILIIGSLGALFYQNIDKETTKTLEATVKYTADNYIIVEDENREEYLLDLKDDYNEGDTLQLTLENITKNKNPKEADVKDINIISRKINLTIEDKKETDIPTETKEENTNIQTQTPSAPSTTTPENNTSTNITTSTEEDVIQYLTTVNNDIDKSPSQITDSIKQNFISLVDFLFYNGKIKGKTFKELSNKAKLQVLKISLSIDEKIEQYYPNYKNTISTKYQNTKSKIVEKYLEITAEICSKNTTTCTEAKNGLSELKKNFSITWSFIKDIAGTSSSKLKQYYELWRESE